MRTSPDKIQLLADLFSANFDDLRFEVSDLEARRSLAEHVVNTAIERGFDVNSLLSYLESCKADLDSEAVMQLTAESEFDWMSSEVRRRLLPLVIGDFIDACRAAQS